MKKEYAIALRNIKYCFKTGFKNEIKKINALGESLSKTNPDLYKKHAVNFFHWFADKKRLYENLLIKAMMIFDAEKRKFNSREVVLVLAGFIAENMEAIQKEARKTQEEEFSQ
ncbi:MAG: hypothetical protein ACOX6H_02560 [Christensenellales bacterium]|jgi:hypothetical protein